MPTYTFHNTKNDEIWEEFLSMKEREEFLDKHPYIKQLIDMPNIVAGVAGITHKTDDGWKENLQRIAEAHPGSALANDHSPDKSIKTVKTRQAVEKWKKKMTNPI